jgi:hypothetical protein
MEIFRMGHDTYGQEVINGLSWGLLPVVFWAAVAIICVHLVVRAVSRGKQGG